jgi:hypothetical protein
MGRPIHKKFFGNRNVGTTGAADDGIGGQGVASVTLGGTWTGFTLATTTVTFSAPQLPGGVTATGTATIVGDAITAIVITEKGSGYTSAPTVTIEDSDAGAEVIGTATAVLTVDTGPVSSPTNQENAIAVFAFVTGGGNKLGDIVKQVGSRRYRVRTADGTMVCSLVTDGVANAAGEMTITATDSSSKTYYVSKLTSRKAVLVPFGSAGHEFVSGTAIRWSFGTAVLNTSVTIANN